MSKPKIFTILGATGHIGHVIAEDLIKRGYTVRCVGRDEKKLHQLKIKGGIPCEVDLTNAFDLAQVCNNAYAVFTLLPPAMDVDDYSAYQDRVGKAIAQALKVVNTERVVNLSSAGAEFKEGTGLIAGLHRQEERLNALASINFLVHLRPNYFMENLYSFLSTIPEGIMSSVLSGDLSIPMVATRDIGWKAADLLDSTIPNSRQVFDFVGPREVTLNEVAEIFGKVFDVPELRYEQISYEDQRHKLNILFDPRTTELILEMEQAMNEGVIKSPVNLSSDHHGTTTLETFAEMIPQRKLAKAA